jgi:hypothetical protein
VALDTPHPRAGDRLADSNEQREEWMHEDEQIVVTSDGGGGVSAGLIAGILIVILILVVIWWFGFGPGTAQPGTNINVNLPTAVPSP